MNCAICEIRKPRRHCPGVHGDICTVCCGTEREQSVDCPLECPYLHDAHEHERKPPLDQTAVPNRDIEITEEFLRTNEILMAYIAVSLMDAAMENRAATDWDVREALDALTKTWRTLQSGLYYETVPTNVFAAGIAAHVHSKLTDIKKRDAEAGGNTIRDSAILGVLVFLQRLEYSHNNGRKRSRAFIDFLREFYSPLHETAESGIVGADEPRVIL